MTNNTDREYTKTYVGWMSFIMNIYREITVSLILLILVLIVLYTGIAMTQEDVRAGKNKVAQKITDNAEIIFEGDMLRKNAHHFKKARYIIEIVPVNGDNSTLMDDEVKATNTDS